MSNEVYPTLPGLDFDVHRAPVWSTSIRKTPSGREYRSGQQIYPLYKRQLTYEFLRSAQAYQELQSLEGFFNRHKGSLDSWLLDDPDDNSVTAHQIGTGNGAITTFQALRNRGGYTEPIYWIKNVLGLTVGDWQTENFSLQPYSRTNLLTYSEGLNQPTWVRNACTTSVNVATGPDGVSVTADKIIPSTSSANHTVSQAITVSNVSAVYYVSSMYFKAAEYSNVYMTLWGTGTTGFVAAAFDLVSGTVQYGNGWITPVGGGWYRCSLWVQGVAGGGSITAVYGPANSVGSGTFIGDGVSGILAWGGQVELCGQNGVSVQQPSRYIPTLGTAVTVPADYTVSSGLFTLASAPPSGALVKWSGGYYWRCRFDTDELDFTKFMNMLWKTGSIPLITVKT